MKSLLLIVASFLSIAVAARAQEPVNTRALLQKYCVRCHNADEHEGDISNIC